MPDVLFMSIGPIGSAGPIGAIFSNELMPIGPIGSTGPIGAICPNELMPIGPIGSTGPIGAICPDELMPIGPIGSVGPISAICLIDADWANWFLGPNWPNMYYACQLGQLVPRAQLVRYVPMN